MNVSTNILDKNDFISDEEMDDLFSQLEQFTPPANMVEQIMKSVAQLPRPLVRPQSQWYGLEVLAVNE